MTDLPFPVTYSQMTPYVPSPKKSLCRRNEFYLFGDMGDMVL